MSLEGILGFALGLVLGFFIVGFVLVRCRRRRDPKPWRHTVHDPIPPTGPHRTPTAHSTGTGRTIIRRARISKRRRTS